VRNGATTRCSTAGGARRVLLSDIIRLSGLGSSPPGAVERWRKPTAVHHPAKIVLNLAVSLALDGECLADIALLRGEPGIMVPAPPTRPCPALNQLPGRRAGQAGGKVLVRVDGADSTQAFLDGMNGQRLSYSVGFGCPRTLLTCCSESRSGRGPGLRRLRPGPRRRLGRRVDRAARRVRLAGREAVIASKDRPHPARNRGWPISTASGSPRSLPTPPPGSCPTSSCGTAAGPRAEDRIRTTKVSGLTNLPLHDFARPDLVVRHPHPGQQADRTRRWPASASMTPSNHSAPSPSTAEQRTSDEDPG
jgi:hypothetical protein